MKRQMWKRFRRRRAVMFVGALLAVAVTTPATAAAGQPSGPPVPAPPSSGVPYAQIPGAKLVALTPARLHQCPWLNPRLPISQRVRMLLAKMTLQDKINMMFAQKKYDGYAGYLLPQPSLCIPPLTSQDDSEGVGDGATGVTQLPAPEALAASWNRNLAYQYGQVNGIEHWGKGIDMVFGPTINIDRLPNWGRSFEVFGEDPYLTGQLAVSNIDGIQSEGVLAQTKHLGVYNQETYRNTTADNDVVSQRALHEIYLPAWRDAVEQGHTASVMCAYSHPNGHFSCNNPYLLTQVLRDRYQFTGFVGSDYGATHHTVASANAGLNLEQGGPKPAGKYYGNGKLYQAVQDGQVSVSTINALVGETLSQMFRFGLFNRQPTGSMSTTVDTTAHAALAEQVAEQGTVLLKNDGALLPFGPSTGSVAVIGSDAGSAALTVTPSPSSARVNAPFTITPCQGIEAAAPAGVSVNCDASNSLSAASAAARAAKVAVVFVANPESEGKDLPTSLALPSPQNSLIAAVAKANPHTVVVLNTGTPVVMPWLSSIQGLINAWYPGEEDGAAIASVLFGGTDPSGHLPVTFPASYAQTPAHTPAQYPGVNGNVQYSEGIFVGYRYYEDNHETPLFPFGYGLSYTHFSFSHLQVTPRGLPVAGAASGSARGLVTVRARITNTGTVAGSDVAQLYLGDPASTGEPSRQLKGFSRVSLAPGQSKTVTFRLDARDLAYWDTSANGWVDAPGTYQVYVGDSSAMSGLPLHGGFQVARSTGPQPLDVQAPPQLAAPGTYRIPVSLANHSGVTDRQISVTLSTSTGGQAMPEASAAKLITVTAACAATGRLNPHAGPGSPMLRSCRSAAPQLMPGQSLSAEFLVTLPASAQAGHYLLTATAAARVPGGRIALRDSVPVSVVQAQSP